MSTTLERHGLFTETIALSGSSTASGQFTVTVSKARSISSVVSAQLVGSNLLYHVTPVSVSGKSITLQLLGTSGATVAGDAAFAAPTAAVTLSGSLSVTYSGY